MIVLLTGLNHRSASLDVREQLSVTEEELPKALSSLAHHVGEGVILSTCNRTEVYTTAEDLEHGLSKIEAFIQDYFGVPYSRLAKYLYTYAHSEAVSHLFRVACGLDSMILGESQVLGQVRDAFSMAVKEKVVGNSLSRLFHQAFRVGKRARRETKISQNALSISHACVELARKVLGDLRGRTALVIGAGEAGRLAGRALRNGGVSEIWVTNRTHERAVELAGELHGLPIPFDEMDGVLTRADMVVASTGSSGYILSRERVKTAIDARGGAGLFLLDIAVPRDIDPAVEELEGASLYDVDDLDSIAEANRHQLQLEARKVEAIIEEEVERFTHWWGSLGALPTIAALRNHGEAIRKREVEKAVKKLRHLSQEEREVVEALSSSLVKKLLHRPIATLKGDRSSSYIQAAKELFHLKGE